MTTHTLSWALIPGIYKSNLAEIESLDLMHEASTFILERADRVFSSLTTKDVYQYALALDVAAGDWLGIYRRTGSGTL